MLYNYIHQGLLEIKVIDLPIGKSIAEKPEEINNRSRFGDWEIDSVLGRKTVGDPSILISVD